MENILELVQPTSQTDAPLTPNITTIKTEVSGSSPEWPTVLCGRQNSYFFLGYSSWWEWYCIG